MKLFTGFAWEPDLNFIIQGVFFYVIEEIVIYKNNVYHTFLDIQYASINMKCYAK